MLNIQCVKKLLEHSSDERLFIKLVKKINPTTALLNHICRSSYLYPISKTLSKYTDFYCNDVYYIHIIYLMVNGVKPDINCLNNLIENQKILYGKDAMKRIYQYINPNIIQPSDFITGETTTISCYNQNVGGYGKSHKSNETTLFSLYNFMTRYGDISPNTRTLEIAKSKNYLHILTKP